MALHLPVITAASVLSSERDASHCAFKRRRSYAILLRGEPYRFGCRGMGAQIQDDAMRSHHEKITLPLQACGHSVDLLLTLDSRSCSIGNTTLKARLASWHGGAAHIWQVQTHAQATNVRAALDAFRPLAIRYDILILSRYDLVLKHQVQLWKGCQGEDKIGVADNCENMNWHSWNCTGDVLFVVPRTLFWAMDAAVGAVEPAVSQGSHSFYSYWDSRNRRRVYKRVMASACFMESQETTSPDVPKGLGHGCYNAIAHRIGYNQVSVCWPDPKGTIRASGMNRSFYQCCSHGEGSLGSLFK